jgi:hypothetical protein
VAKPGFFGSDGRYSFEAETQFMKVPHLRNAYQKVGMFGMANTFGLPIDEPITLLSFLPPPLNDLSFKGDQVRGFGFLHDGSVDTLFRFLGGSVFVQRPIDDLFPNPGGISPDAAGIAVRRQLEAFTLAFDSNLAPIVGQQVTMASAADAFAADRVDLLEERAGAGECELVVHSGSDLAMLYDPDALRYDPDNSEDPGVSSPELRSLAAAGHELTFTCVPPRSGLRIGLDRDLDGTLDGDEDPGGGGGSQ